jgi:hydrogenase nickel incorporation protein HypB
VGCDLDRLEANVRSAAPGARVLRLSARTGEGMAAWAGLLAGLVPAHAD